MFEIMVLNKKTNKTFVKNFNDSINAYKFVRKVKYSNDLELLYVYDYTNMYD